MFNSKLKEEIRTLRDLLERAQQEAGGYRDELAALRAKEQSLVPLSVTYTLTDSDFVKFRQQASRRKNAKQRMAHALAYKIEKEFEVQELTEDGVVVGYRYEIEARTI